MRDLYDGAKPFNEYAKAVLKRPANKKLATGKTTTTKIPIPHSDHRKVPEKKVQAEILDWHGVEAGGSTRLRPSIL
jgi:hypothetical protein